MALLLSNGLFDFQEEAVEHCRRRLVAGRYCILGLDVGLGKTVVCRETLKRLGVSPARRAAVFCPSGLGNQIGEELAKEEATIGAVAVANTGKQLVAALDRTDVAVLVVNVALRLKAKSLGTQWAFVVVDEAHVLAGSLHLTRRDRILESVGATARQPPPILFMTAHPHYLSRNILVDSMALNSVHWGGENMSCTAALDRAREEFPEDNQKFKARFRELADIEIEEREREYNEALFVMKKTSAIAAAVGSAAPELRVRRLAPPTRYKELILDKIKKHNLIPSPDPFGALAAQPHGPRAEELREKCLAIEIVHQVCGPADDEEEPIIGAARAAFRASPAYGDPALRVKALSILYKVHCSIISSDQFARTYGLSAREAPDPPWTEPLPVGSKCLLIRYPDQHILKAELDAAPPAQGVKVMKLTRTLSAQRRAAVVKSALKGSAPLVAFKRAAQSKGALGRVLRIGNSWFLNEVLSFVEPRLVVIAADSAVDIGYNLHKYVDTLWIDLIPDHASTLQQIVGRLCRTDPSRIGKNDKVAVMVNLYEKTLDELFYDMYRAEAAATDQMTD